MSWDPRVDLAFAHNLVRHAASTIDPNDAQRLIDRVERWGWEDWCRLWSEEAARHETLAKEAAAEKVGQSTRPRPGARGMMRS